ncbi:MAG: cupin domain-containing protein [Sedimenticola sp.]
MTRIKSITLAIGAISILLVVFLSAVSVGQVKRPGFSAKPMMVGEISGVNEKQIAIINVSIQPGASSPLHTHPGDCYGAVLKGNVELFVEGKTSRLFSAGEAWHNPRGPVHYFKNVGDTPVQLVNTLVVDKGKKRTQIHKVQK